MLRVPMKYLVVLPVIYWAIGLALLRQAVKYCQSKGYLMNVFQQAPPPIAPDLSNSLSMQILVWGLGIVIVIVIAVLAAGFFFRGFATGLAAALLEQAKKYPLSSHTRLWLENRIRTVYRWHGTGNKTVAANMVAELAGTRKTAPKTPERQAEVRDLDEYRRRHRAGAERRKAA